jgi:hypothetical protein
MTDSDPGRDPIAELARLIGQADSHGESAPVDRGFPDKIALDGYDELPALPLAPQLPGYLNAPEQADDPDDHCLDNRAFDADQTGAADEEYRNDVPPVRRRSLTLVMAISGLALVGTAGAFGYRDMFAGSALPSLPPITKASREPNKIAPASSEPQATNSGNASQAGIATVENLVSSEGRPIAIQPPKTAPRVISTIPIEPRRGSLTEVSTPTAPAQPAAGYGTPYQSTPRRVAAAEDPPLPPRGAAATSQRAGQSDTADITAASNRAHWAAGRVALANPNNTAEVTPPALGSGYAVQVTSERSESRAHSAFRALQAKYPNQLSGRQSIIRRADLGAAGTYYRALVGPFASAQKAARLCSGLKAAGGDCIIQKN